VVRRPAYDRYGARQERLTNRVNRRMRGKSWALLLGALLGAALCFRCESPSSPSGLGDRWLSVSEKTWCFIPYADANCLGFQGFVVRRDGSYSAGEAVNGRVSVAELSALQKDVALLDPSFHSECDQPGHSDYQDDVRLTLTDNTSILLWSFAEGCYRGGRDQAKRVSSDIRALMERYYPIPFPVPDRSSW
jgi:hypothetical protein